MNRCAAGQHRAAGPFATEGPLAWFNDLPARGLAWAREARTAGRPLVGIMCEFSPRELILAAGGVPAVLCGGNAASIPGAEQELPAGLCPLIKSTYGNHLAGCDPVLEMADVVVAETTCDGKRKMFELMGRRRTMWVLELPQQPDRPGALEAWLERVWWLRRQLEERYGQPISDARLRECIALVNRERRCRRALAELLKADDPPITGRQLLAMHSSIFPWPELLERYEQTAAMLAGNACGGTANTREEGCAVQVAAQGGDGRRQTAGSCGSGFGLQTSRRPRVLLTGVPVVRGAEKVIDLIEGCGALAVAQENCTGLKPVLEEVDESAADPMRAIAEKYLRLPCSVMSPNDRRMESLTTMAAEYRAECIIDLVWQGCLTYDVESRRVRELAGTLGLPYLRIETDYGPADAGRLAMRIEALLELTGRA